MDLVQIMTVSRRLFVFAGVLLLSCIYKVVQTVVWYIDGTAKKVADAKMSEYYASCVQVLDIRLFYSFEPLVFWSRKHFILKHNRFDSPRYIIENDHVTLMSIDDEYAIFVEARTKGMQLWKTEYSGFMILSQLKYGNRLLLVPMEHFHRMTVELEPINMESIIFLFNTGRCGSTLMSQVMEHTGDCLSIAEPGALSDLSKNPSMLVANEHLCSDVVRLICRPLSDFKPLFYFLKISAAASAMLPNLYSALPRSRYLFMYRNPSDVAKSYLRGVQELPYHLLLSLLARVSISRRQKFLSKFNLSEGLGGAESAWDDVALVLIHYTEACRFYLKSRRDGVPIAAFRYEDLVSHPKDTLTTIFQYCDLPISLVSSSLNGMALDSQRMSPLSVERLKRHEIHQLSSRSKSFANELLRHYRLPLIGDECILEGTMALPK